MDNIFLLEDEESRIRKFKSQIPNIIIASNVDDAKAAVMREERWDIFFLDHDLGGEQMVDTSKYNTGTTFVRWMVKKNIKVNLVIVHSLNKNAADGMISDLINAGYTARHIPYTSFSGSI